MKISIGNALLASVVGILVVFAGLCILIGLIKILALATANIGKTKVKKETAPAPVSAPAPEPVVVEESNDDALIAVITAAVACMMDEASGFTVRRVRRISTAPAWQKAGREEQIYSRF